MTPDITENIKYFCTKHGTDVDDLTMCEECAKEMMDIPDPFDEVLGG